MRQFLNKWVKYIGENTELLSRGSLYKVNSYYGGNISIIVSETEIGNKMLLSVPHTDFEIESAVNSDLNVHSILSYKGDIVGVRLIDDSLGLVDIEADSMKKLTTKDCVGFKLENLIELNGLLMTEDEKSSKYQVSDRSKDREFIARALELFNIA